MNEQAVLRVTYSPSDPYAQYIGISLLSLLKTNSAAFARIECYVLDCGISELNRRRLMDLAAPYRCTLTFLPVTNIGVALGLQGSASGMAVKYARLFLSTLVPADVDRILYLDCDTLVTDELTALWATPLDTAYVAGVQDTIDLYFQKVIGLPAGQPYLNAGVLLINLKRWRDDKLEARFIAFIRRFGGQVPFHDQGTVNGVCGTQRALLPLRFNMTSNLYSFSVSTIERIYFIDRFYSQPELDEALRSPAIIHFTPGLVGRPWEEPCAHPEQERFLAMKRDTPWSGVPLTPRTLEWTTRLFAFYYRHVPRRLFEASYRMLSQLRHIGH
jgi:lipopolysaccharide biosynthesis glycosyltransferase